MPGGVGALAAVQGTMSAQRKLLLLGAVASAAVGLNRFAVADELPTLAQPGADDGWYTQGSLEAGGQVFIKKPGNSPANSAAKFNEYGDRTAPSLSAASTSGWSRGMGRSAPTCSAATSARTIRSSSSTSSSREHSI